MRMLLLFVGALFACKAYADTETINWYVDNSVYDTTTCQTGGNVTAPATQPTKYGYTFDGWEIAIYDFSTLDPATAGTNYAHDASSRTWSTTFPYGIVNGVSLCSVTPGSYAVAGTPDESTVDGQYCWCKATGYTPSNSNIVYEPTSSLAWVFNDGYGLASLCASDCANSCGNYVRFRSAFRRTVFGVQ